MIQAGVKTVFMFQARSPACVGQWTGRSGQVYKTEKR